jgi:hypothetical protein
MAYAGAISTSENENKTTPTDSLDWHSRHFTFSLTGTRVSACANTHRTSDSFKCNPPHAKIDPPENTTTQTSSFFDPIVNNENGEGRRWARQRNCNKRDHP